MNPPLRLGLMPPLTGLVALYGPEISRAARIACDEINERGGVLGRRLELVIEDDGSLPDTAVPAALRLTDAHGCAAIIGNLLSNSRIAVAAQVAEPRRVPYLNFSFYEGSIAGRYFFHFAALPNQQIAHMIPFMARRHGSKMFFAGNNYEWPRGSIDAAKRALLALEGDAVGEEYLPIGVHPQEIDRLLEQVAVSGCDVFVPYFAGDDQIALLTRFHELGLKRRMAVVMGHYDEAMVARLAPEVREGLHSSNTYFMSLDTPANHAVLARLAREPGVRGLWPAGDGVMTNFGEGAYVCVHAFANAAETAGTVEAEALVDALETVRVDAPQGWVEMDAETHHASVNTCLARCNSDGSFTVIEHFGRIAPEIPERYRAQMRTARLHESPASPEVAAQLADELGRARRKIGTAQKILSIADMAILATDARGVIVEANRVAGEIFRYGEGEMIGLSVHLLVPPHLRPHHAEMLRQFVAGRESERRMNVRRELMGYRKDGSFFPLEASIAKFRNGEGPDDWLLVVTLRDITERKRADEDLTRRATHDPLTGLPNRALIRERLVNALQRSRRNGWAVVLLFVDLDGFKLVNDTHGHEAGDALLKTATSRLVEQVRAGDTVARLAGDEFVVLCEQVEQPSTASMIAQRINDSLRQPFEFGALQLFVTASVGIAIGTGSTHTADDLMRHADAAMYEVKQKGRDGWAFFNESLEEQARKRLAITNGLRFAIERDEFSLRYQPIVAAESGRIVGAEALLRWKPPEGEVSPAAFIPVAEMTGSIVPIGAWVFREACLTAARWQARWGEQAPYLSINLSTRQLSEEDLTDRFAGILRETGADPARLLLEITETSLMTDVEMNLRVLRRLAGLGMRVAVDDFGTGYSSLAQLKRLPVDVLKIDRAFVDGIDKQEEARAIVRAVIGLGHALGLQLVAEGVETAEQRRELCVHRCDFLQGYFLHRPLAVADLEAAVDRELRDAGPAGTPALHFLIYVSRASRPLSAEELDALRKRVARANRAAGISGCLLHQDGEFMQMLEGRRDTLLALFERIRADRRHQDVRQVIEAPAVRRVFQDWGMTVRDLSAPAAQVDFSRFRRRRIGLSDLAEDALACYRFITAFAAPGGR